MAWQFSSAFRPRCPRGLFCFSGARYCGRIPSACGAGIGLPDIDGIEVARRLRVMPEFRDRWLVAVTGYDQDDDRPWTAEAGFDLHLLKPFDSEQLQGFSARVADGQFRPAR